MANLQLELTNRNW